VRKKHYFCSINIPATNMKKSKFLFLCVYGCLAWLTAGAQVTNPFGKALVPDMVADASIQRVGDTFYCYATTDGYGKGLETSGPPVVWTSKDFLHWSFEGVCFPSADGEKYWAPSKAVERNGRWYIYPTVNGIMHVGVADRPEGPFRLAKGADVFTKPFARDATLRQGDDRGGIDAEVFVDDDGQAYVFWGGRHVAKLATDMMTLTEERTLETRRKEYSEGPIFFKRRGIYYYMYTIGGDENYEYYYMMSRTSPMGPYETPVHDLVATTDVEKGVFGPGHGCVFNVGDDYYFAFLEFGRNSTNRQTYVNRMQFNGDGSIRQVEVTLDGVGALSCVDEGRELKPVAMTASSVMEKKRIRYFNDSRCQRTEQFVAEFATDRANGSRWMAKEEDTDCWLMADLGEKRMIGRSELCFVRPTAGHAYVLEGSTDGQRWERCGGHTDVERKSPHVDEVRKAYRYVRVKITEGIRGVWEWRLLAPMEQKGQRATSEMSGLSRRGQPNWGDWQSWGEQKDGTYWNPVIPADYSDLDCIRVGDDYYAISSTMQFAPGMTVLHSKDLVNWDIVGNAVEDVSQIGKGMTWQEMDRYGRGVWAGTIRYHEGRFYVFFGTPDEGYFMTSSERAEGPWEPLTVLLAESGWDDCTALWDEKGRGWFVGTCFRDGYKTYRFSMAKDGRSINRESATLLNEGMGREANKLIQHGKYYYLIYSEHRDGVGRYVMAKRDKHITGRFSEAKQLLQPCREANEPNQGGIVEGKDGKWYFVTHHGSGDWSGRVMSVLPVEWADDWPMMGDQSESELGKMMWSASMPVVGADRHIQLQRSDDFDDERLGAQWQWNYQPRKEKFSLTERKGWLRLRASTPLEQGRLLKACNTLTQRSFRTPQNEVVVKMDISHATDGMRAGLCHFAEHSASVGFVCEKGKCYVEYRKDDRSERGEVIDTPHLWLKSTWGLDGRSEFYYSTDGDHYLPMGQYQLSWGFYRGDRIGVFCFNDVEESGWVDVDYLHYRMDKSEKLKVKN